MFSRSQIPDRASPNSRAQRGAFTLIEMLVVIAIIVILLSFLVPVISKAMDRARNVQCMSNLRQCGIATLGYAAEYQLMPSADTTGNATPEEQENQPPPSMARRWSLQLRLTGFLPDDDVKKWHYSGWGSSQIVWNADYVSRKVVSVCPATRWDKSLKIDTGNYDYGVRNKFLDAENYQGKPGDAEHRGDKRAVRVSSINMNLPFITDTIDAKARPLHSSMGFQPDYESQRIYFRHGNGKYANAWYPDGSVRRIDDTALVQLQEITGWNWIAYRESN